MPGKGRAGALLFCCGSANRLLRNEEIFTVTLYCICCSIVHFLSPTSNVKSHQTADASDEDEEGRALMIKPGSHSAREEKENESFFKKVNFSLFPCDHLTTDMFFFLCFCDLMYFNWCILKQCGSIKDGIWLKNPIVNHTFGLQILHSFVSINLRNNGKDKHVNRDDDFSPCGFSLLCQHISPF